MINIPQFSVSEFSRSIKRVVEDSFGYVKIKGEVSGFKKAASGHLYFNLKEQNCLLSAVFFRNMAQLTKFEIADGLEVCAWGKITTYDGRSNYQIIVEKLEIAGIGAILEMIEKRRKKLLAQGLFDQEHKQTLPFFPQKIGVITSQTGAVIQDIKHRISERFPTNILLYPTAVQGENAASQVILGIKFFNNMAQAKKPDVIIIARGGGSFEDLMPFNDENLVKEVFKSQIPIISAIGHETDTSLIDYVSDVRAPTPSAAAEIATPILAELQARINFCEQKLKILPQNLLEQKLQNLNNLQRYILSPKQSLHEIDKKLVQIIKKFDLSVQNALENKSQKLMAIQIAPNFMTQKINLAKQNLEFVSKNLNLAVNNKFKQVALNLTSLQKLLQANHYDQILKRGFALIKNKDNNLISSVSLLKNTQEVTVEMHDGKLDLLTAVNKLK